MTSPSNFSTEIDVFLALCWKLGTPVAYRAIKCVERSDWLGLLSLKAEPAHYVCAKTYLEDAQVVSFLKKFQGFDLGIDLEKKAMATFWESEHQCFRSNERLSPLLFDRSHYGERVAQLIAEWRKEIRSVLGKCPEPSSLDGKFGPGSTYGNRGNLITLADKLSEDYTATLPAKTFLHSWDMTAWSRYAACSLDTVGDISVATCGEFALYPGEPYAARDFEYVRGNRFTTVNKDALKKRGICVEPSLNVFYQLAYGSYMSDRMKRVYGWDKKIQQEYHKFLARVGSLTGAIATIDLSNASDTVCFNLVKLLLPRDWFDMVCRLRSSHTCIPPSKPGGKSKWVKLEKFSSMGNGFTFELETLIFYTLAKVLCRLEAVGEDRFTPGLAVSVFGDDIVVPKSISRSMLAALAFFGFTPNASKTFVDGPFRESCGGDYFKGRDVRPHFHKEAYEEPHHLIALANGIRRFGRRLDDLGGNGSHRVAWFRCIDALPRQISICRGPESLGDLVIHDDEAHWRSRNPIRVRNSIRYLRVWRPVSNRVIGWEHYRPGVVLAVALYGGSSGLSNSYTKAHDPKDHLRRSGVVPRVNGSYVSGYRFGRVAYS